MREVVWLDSMVAAAHEVAAALGSEVVLPLTDGRRTDWTYVPSRRHGIALADMDQSQRRLVHGLLTSVLSDEAYAKVCAIVSLEEVLDRLEGGTRHRHSGNYWVGLYGEPGTEEWAWSFEGHHVSVNIAVARGELRPTPLFLGANPHSYAIRPLGQEEDLARAALQAMPATARQTAIIADTAPDDIVTTTQEAVDVWELEPLGVPGTDLPDDAWRHLDALLRIYAGRVRPSPETPDRDEIWFAWAGGSTPATPHYYRLQSPATLIEYDNTQNDANHSHTVWRVPGADFGADLLRHHRSEHHT